MISTFCSSAGCEGPSFLSLLPGCSDFILYFFISTGAAAADCDWPCGSAGTWAIVMSVCSTAAPSGSPFSGQGEGFPPAGAYEANAATTGEMCSFAIWPIFARTPTQSGWFISGVSCRTGSAAVFPVSGTVSGPMAVTLVSEVGVCAEIQVDSTLSLKAKQTKQQPKTNNTAGHGMFCNIISK